MKDRMLKGVLAASLVGLWVLANDLLWHNVLHFAKSSWLDGLTYLALGAKPTVWPEAAMGVVAHLTFGGILGALFARVVLPQPGAGNYLLRGMAWGWFVWFATAAVGTIFRIPELYHVAWQTSLTQLFSAVTWGAGFGWLFRRWDVGVDRVPPPGV